MKTLALLTVLLTAPAAYAQFSPNPALNLAVRDQPGITEVLPRTAPAPNGGTWVSWFEAVLGTNYQLRIQLLDRSGNPQLGPAGVVVNNQPQSSALYRYDLKADAAGNALVAIQDTRNGTMQAVVHKIGPGGQLLWGTNGIQLLDNTATGGLAPTIAVLNSGNVVVAWNASTTTTGQVSMQKFSPVGVALWASPVRVRGTGSCERPVPLPCGPDDVLLCYVRRSGFGLGVSAVQAQRFDAAGGPAWPNPVVVSSQTIGFGFFPEPVADGADGFFVALNSGNPTQASLGDVWVQRVRADGTLWSPTGTPALTGTATARFDGHLQLVAGRNELWTGLTVTNSGQSQSGLSLQRLDPATGTTQLGANGVAVQPISPTLARNLFLRDTGTGLVLLYSESPTAVTDLLKATKVDYQGVAAWPAPIALASANSGKLHFDATAFRANQLVLVWEDERQGQGIYAQNLSDTGTLGPLATARFRPAAPLQLAPNPSPTPTLYWPASAHPTTLLVRDLTGRVVFKTSVSGTASYTLDGPALALGAYLIEATDDAGNRWHTRWVRN